MLAASAYWSGSSTGRGCGGIGVVVRQHRGSRLRAASASASCRGAGGAAGGICIGDERRAASTLVLVVSRQLGTAEGIMCYWQIHFGSVLPQRWTRGMFKRFRRCTGAIYLLVRVHQGGLVRGFIAATPDLALRLQPWLLTN
ncbi:uncharacterized protein LOC124655352 isoform X2 [Lolium rigidum]|uniref:uncharacterized protein LOC124655352 isoform X2 n=1 Tax=Lolium rigidum TaxID=89674 RepID=UPI001F5C3DA2|nr:uncharacterized protein LOC124655352 isoform X2 [Lolium rigidum]